jgi:hypothetical protein
MRRYSKIFNKRIISRFAFLVLTVWIMACTPSGNSGSGDVLVRVYDKYLYASDLEGIIPAGTSTRDSLTVVRTFVRNWVDRQLIVKKARENLPEDLKDFSDRIEQYRNSLIIFEYEKMLVRQELDTNISLEAIQEYYQRNKGNFILKDDIMNLQYLVLHTDSPAISKFRQYIKSEVSEEKDSLALYSSKYAESFNLMEEFWLDMEEVSDILPLESYSFMQFNANHRYLELRDSVYIYMIYVRDYKPADSVPPMQFVEDKIQKIILNRRKNDLIKNMRQTVLQDAIEHNQVEIY